jgi:hypothetical protein
MGTIAFSNQHPFIVDVGQKIRTTIAMLHFVEAERRLKAEAKWLQEHHRDLWDHQVKGIQAARKDPVWRPTKKITLDPLIKMVSPFQGPETNKALLVLPYYENDYRMVCDVRNAIGHGDWESVNALGGPNYCVEVAESFARSRRHLSRSISSQVAPQRWTWKQPRSPSFRSEAATTRRIKSLDLSGCTGHF